MQTHFVTILLHYLFWSFNCNPCEQSTAQADLWISKYDNWTFCPSKQFIPFFFYIFLLYQWWCLLANAKNDCKLIFSAIKNTHIKWNNSDLLLPRTVDQNYRAIKYKTYRFSSCLVCISNESVIVFLWISLTKIQLEIPIRSSVPVYRKKCLPRWDKCNEYKLSNKSFGGIESFSGNELFLDAWLSKYDCTSDLGANKIERKTKSYGKFVQNDATWDSISNFVFLFITKQKWFDLNWGKKNSTKKWNSTFSRVISMCPSNCIDKECFCRCKKNRFEWKKNILWNTKNSFPYVANCANDVSKIFQCHA